VAKPDVRAFAIAAAALRAPPGRTAMVGDSLHNDVLGALAAGFASVVWVGRGEGELPAGAQRARGLSAAADLLLAPAFRR
jgi:putative hydrolase of the HAD superfamily